MAQTRIRVPFTVKDCYIFGTNGSWNVFTAKGEAVIETRTKEKKLCTKSGAEYLVTREEYALVVCRDPETDATFESFENVESFNALFVFHIPNENDQKCPINNIIPEQIDLSGEWVFKISDDDGEKLRRLNERAN